MNENKLLALKKLVPEIMSLSEDMPEKILIVIGDDNECLQYGAETRDNRLQSVYDEKAVIKNFL